MPGKKKGFPVLVRVGLVAVIAVLFWSYYLSARIQTERGTSGSVQFERPAEAQKTLRNHIAYVGNDAQIRIVSPSGEDPILISTRFARYAMPTWSPDGRRLAFLGETAPDRVAVYVSPTTESDATVLTLDPASQPFYLYWSPDSQSMTYLAQEGAVLAMHKVSLSDPKSNLKLGEGAPLYWSWSNDGAALLAHIRQRLFLIEDRPDAQPTPLDTASRRFQTPAWSADDSAIYFVARGQGDRSAIYTACPDVFEPAPITEVHSFCRMVLSPNNPYLACIMAEPNVPSHFGRALLVSPDGTGTRRIGDSLASALFWSPDGKKLALLVPSQGREMPPMFLGTEEAIPAESANFERGYSTGLWTYDVEKDQLTPQVTFLPTREFLALLPHFDQYHLSHTFWSPDSRYIVISAREPGALAGTLWIVDTQNQEQPRRLADGTFAVWSWQ